VIIWKQTGPADDTITILVNGQTVIAHPGETVATVLLRLGYRAFGNNAVTGKPSAPACMMGICFGCLCRIDGRPGTQACLEPVQNGLAVEIDIQVAP
jgi:hypothetical protein